MKSDLEVANLPCGKIRTTQGTNQNAPFHHGPVQPYNKGTVVLFEGYYRNGHYTVHGSTPTLSVLVVLVSRGVNVFYVVSVLLLCLYVSSLFLAD